MILRFICGVLLGVLATFYTAQKDLWVKRKMGDSFNRLLSETFNCKVSGTILSVDLIRPYLSMADFSMKAHDDSWEWSTKIYRAGFSWVDVIKKGFIAWWIQMKDLQAFSKMNGTIPAILPHLQDLMKGPVLPIPLVLSESKIRTAILKIADTDSETVCKWHCDAYREGSAFCLKIRLLDGEYLYKRSRYISDIRGIINITTQLKNKDTDYAMQLDVKGNVAHLGEYPTCFITGNWYHNSGRFQVQSYDKSLRINPLVIGEKDDEVYIEAQAYLPLSFMYKLFFNVMESPLAGNCTVQFKGSITEGGSSDGFIVCEEVQHPWLTERCMLNAIFSKRADQCQGVWDIKYGFNHALHGSFAWFSHEQNGTASLFNETTFLFPFYSFLRVNPHDAQLRFSYDWPTDTIDGMFSVTGSNELNGSTVESKGKYSIDAARLIKAQGRVGSYRYAAKGSLWSPYLSYMKIWDAKKNTIFDWVYDETAQQYQSTIDFSIIQNICDSFLHYDMQGEGKIRCTGNKKDDLFFLNCTLEEATIRLPQTFNFISDATVDIVGDFSRKRLIFKNLSCSLHNGTMKSSKGVIWLNEQAELQFVHFPFLIDRCLVTAKQDFFAMISGSLLFSKKYNDPVCIAGNIMIDRAQLKENLFSEQLQKKLFLAAGAVRNNKEFPLLCDLSIETKDPIRVDTHFLQANAHVNLTAKNSVYDPVIEGSIHVPLGTIRFPYKPLNITKGDITFVKEQSFNPLVELVAKNKIKNHTITLNVTGLLQDTTVLLEATPPLSEEQIIGLLIAGTHEHSLDAVIPALLMQNVTHYIFSSHKSNFFERYIKPWMKQVNVSLKPNFSDQSGRGGLRGILEVVVNDRWRAAIEKNFSLTEDTHFELEYIVSDDITLRVIRDERRDVGGEVEMKWKF